MLKIKITYNGKPVSSLEDALTKAIVNGITKIIEEKLAPFADEIKESGASVDINIDKDFKPSVILNDAPKELQDKITDVVG